MNILHGHAVENFIVKLCMERIISRSTCWSQGSKSILKACEVARLEDAALRDVVAMLKPHCLGAAAAALGGARQSQSARILVTELSRKLRFIQFE